MESIKSVKAIYGVELDDLCLCCDCLKVEAFTQGKHIGDIKCSCGGDFCGSLTARKTIEALTLGKRTAKECELQFDIYHWAPTNGVEDTFDYTYQLNLNITPMEYSLLLEALNIMSVKLTKHTDVKSEAHRDYLHEISEKLNILYSDISEANQNITPTNSTNQITQAN